MHDGSIPPVEPSQSRSQISKPNLESEHSSGESIRIHDSEPPNWIRASQYPLEDLAQDGK